MRDDRVVRVLTLAGRAAGGGPTAHDGLSAALARRLCPQRGAAPVCPSVFARWPLRVERVTHRGRAYFWIADDVTPLYALYAPVAHVSRQP